MISDLKHLKKTQNNNFPKILEKPWSVTTIQSQPVHSRELGLSVLESEGPGELMGQVRCEWFGHSDDYFSGRRSERLLPSAKITTLYIF